MNKTVEVDACLSSIFDVRCERSSTMDKSLRFAMERALGVLSEVEHRRWHEVLLSSVDPVNEGGEVLKLMKIAAGYKQFNREYKGCDIDTKLEVYAVLRAAYDNRRFPARKHLSRAQFERLLMMHLERF